jgi:hypothetical protein
MSLPVRNKRENLRKNLSGILKATEENSRIRISRIWIRNWIREISVILVRIRNTGWYQ